MTTRLVLLCGLCALLGSVRAQNTFTFFQDWDFPGNVVELSDGQDSWDGPERSLAVAEAATIPNFAGGDISNRLRFSNLGLVTYAGTAFSLDALSLRVRISMSSLAGFTYTYCWVDSSLVEIGDSCESVVIAASSGVEESVHDLSEWDWTPSTTASAISSNNFGPVLSAARSDASLEFLYLFEVQVRANATTSFSTPLAETNPSDSRCDGTVCLQGGSVQLRPSSTDDYPDSASDLGETILCQLRDSNGIDSYTPLVGAYSGGAVNCPIPNPPSPGLPGGSSEMRVSLNSGADWSSYASFTLVNHCETCDADCDGNCDPSDPTHQSISGPSCPQRAPGVTCDFPGGEPDDGVCDGISQCRVCIDTGTGNDPGCGSASCDPDGFGTCCPTVCEDAETCNGQEICDDGNCVAGTNLAAGVGCGAGLVCDGKGACVPDLEEDDATESSSGLASLSPGMVLLGGTVVGLLVAGALIMLRSSKPAKSSGKVPPRF